MTCKSLGEYRKPVGVSFLDLSKEVLGCLHLCFTLWLQPSRESFPCSTQTALTLIFWAVLGEWSHKYRIYFSPAGFGWFSWNKQGFNSTLISLYRHLSGTLCRIGTFSYVAFHQYLMVLLLEGCGLPKTHCTGRTTPSQELQLLSCNSHLISCFFSKSLQLDNSKCTERAFPSEVQSWY